MAAPSERTLLACARLERDLAERGHEAVRITGARARAARLPGLHLAEEGMAAVPGIVLALAHSRFDLAHAFDAAAGWAAARAHRLGGPPYILMVEPVLTRRYLVSRRRRIEILREAAASAARVIVRSEDAAEAMRRYAIADPQVVAEPWDAAGCEALYRLALRE